MPRGLDHVVHAARDLDAAVNLYRRLGFTVGARNRHAWGTHNHLVQLPGFFVELLTVAEPEKLGADGFSALFGTFNRVFLKDREGLSLLILESRDAVADAALFRQAGIAVSDALHFEQTIYATHAFQAIFKHQDHIGVMGLDVLDDLGASLPYHHIEVFCFQDQGTDFQQIGIVVVYDYFLRHFQ